MNLRLANAQEVFEGKEPENIGEVLIRFGLTFISFKFDISFSFSILSSQPSFRCNNVLYIGTPDHS